MMNKSVRYIKRNGLFLSACFVSMISLFSSCKKTTNDVGISVLNTDQLLQIGGVDTFSLTTYTVKEDSLPTDNQSFAVLGSCHDPVMGIFNASFYSQFGLVGTTSFNSGDVAVVDSVVLALDYAGSFGKMDPLTFQVFEIGSPIENRDYYKHETIAPINGNLADPSSATQTPDVLRDVIIDGDTLDPQLRIKLVNTFGQQLINDAVSGNTAFTSDANFKNYFKGLKVDVQQTNPAVGEGGILYLDLNKNATKLTVYYKLNGGTETVALDLQIEDDCYDFNHVDINQTGYKPNDILTNPSIGQTSFYAQAFTSRGFVGFPGISNLKKSTVIQNALLELPIEHHPLSVYYPSLLITAAYKLDNGDLVGFKTASYNSTRKSYTFDLRDYFQDVVAGKEENRGIYINTTFYFSSSADRIVFNGPETTNKLKPKLVVKYTEF